MGGVASLETVLETVAQARSKGASVVLTNGAFDMLHVGHVRYLQGAAQQGDIVVTAVNSDSSVRHSKGPSRPVIPEQERAELVAALGVVDWVASCPYFFLPLFTVCLSPAYIYVWLGMRTWWRRQKTRTPVGNGRGLTVNELPGCERLRKLACQELKPPEFSTPL